MRFIIINLILLLMFNCEKKENINCWDPWFGQCYFVYNTIIKPKEDSEKKCKVENSIDFTGTTRPDSDCINNRVVGQIIFDTSNKLVAEKIIPGIAVQCLCPDTSIPATTYWSKGNELNLETFPPNVEIDLISFSIINLNTTNYPIGTNLFCINRCKEGTNKSIDRYQVLKLRSNP